jgi:hypothetical protein
MESSCRIIANPDFSRQGLARDYGMGKAATKAAKAPGIARTDSFDHGPASKSKTGQPVQDRRVEPQTAGEDRIAVERVTVPGEAIEQGLLRPGRVNDADVREPVRLALACAGPAFAPKATSAAHEHACPGPADERSVLGVAELSRDNDYAMQALVQDGLHTRPRNPAPSGWKRSGKFQLLLSV